MIMQPHIFLSSHGQLKKGIDHRLNILDRCKPHDCPDVDPAVLLLQWDLREPLVVNAIFNYSAFFASQPIWI